MRTLQEKYNAIQEGAFSKDQFLRDARMQHPTLVTQYNGYDDAVQILKNRGMISENSLEAIKDQLLSAPIGAKAFGGGYGPFKKVKDNTWENPKTKSLSHSQALASQIGGFEDFKIEEPVKEVLKEARLTKNTLVDYRYKPTNEMDKYPYEQILRGLRVELEGMEVHGTPTAEEYKKALGKVLKNLEKDEIFYTNQLAGKKASEKRTDEMIPVEKNNTVDKANAMEKAPVVKEDASKKCRVVTVKKGEYQVWQGDKLLKTYDQRYEAEGHRNRCNSGDINEAFAREDLKEGFKKLIRSILLEEEVQQIPVREIEKLVHVANALIEKAVDEDGDPIGVIDTSGTWQEPEYYQPIEFNGDKLTIKSTSYTKPNDVSVEELVGEGLYWDAIPTLRNIIKLYKKALKKHNIEEVSHEDSQEDKDDLFESVSLKDLLS